MARKKPVKPVAKTDSYEEEDYFSTEMAEKVDVQQSPQIQPQNDDDSSSSDDETKKHPKKAIKYSSEEDEKQQKQPSSVIQKSEKSVSKPKMEKRPRPLEDKQNSVSSKKPKKEKEEGMSSYLKWKGVDTVECDDGKDRLRKKGMELMGEKERVKLLEMWDEVDMAQMKVDRMQYQVLEEENRRIVEALSESGKPRV